MTFVDELERFYLDGDLTVSDLAVWFARPRQTLHSWLYWGHVPKEDRKLREAERRLMLLLDSKAFPVPYEITKRQRAAYIKQAFEDADNAGVPRKNPAPRGALLRGVDQ